MVSQGTDHCNLLGRSLFAREHDRQATGAEAGRPGQLLRPLGRKIRRRRRRRWQEEGKEEVISVKGMYAAVFRSLIS